MKILSQPEITPHIEQRFWALVDRSDPDGCWEWKGGRWDRYGQKGYGVFKIKHEGKWQRFKAHRISYLLAHGHFPKHLACHTCDNPVCVRPDHLFDGTNADNLADMKAKGRAATGLRSGRYTMPERTARGEHAATSKLTEAQVLEIRATYKRGDRHGRGYGALAAKYGVSKFAIRMIVIGRHWRHLLPTQEDRLAA